MSPGSSPTATARTARRRIFAERVFGSASTSTTREGLNGRPSSLATSSDSSPASSGSAPGATTKHHTASPFVSSGTPTTADSATSGWLTSTDSTSAGPSRLPATLIVSSERPSTNHWPSSSTFAQSPWRQMPSYVDQYVSR